MSDYDFSDYDNSADSFSDPTDFTWGEAPGADSSTVVDSSSGNITYTYDDGSTLTVGPSGNVVSNTESADSTGNSVAFNRALAWTTRNLGPTAARVMSQVAKTPGASLLTALAAAKAFGGSDSTGGYSKPVPKMDVVRELADRIIVLHNGSLVADGEPNAVIASPIVQEAYLGKAREAA